MMRVCHLDTCPVGIATQNPELRKHFTGQPEFIETFFNYIAEECRELLAALGFRTMAEAVGHVESLDTVAAVDHYWKAGKLDLRPILEPVSVPVTSALHRTRDQDHGLEAALDRELIEACDRAISEGRRGELDRPIRNVHRAVGTMLGSEITRRYGGAGLPDGTIALSFRGSAGQSFGAFVPRGITMTLVGDANDYLGKGLSGGIIVVRPPEGSPFRAEEQIIAGNVVLYGATSGMAFIRGQVGERFCVRNSGATAVVEGVGDHACEYMTGGTVLVLGPTGRNFAAGMSGGLAFVHDPDAILPRRLNPEMVELEQLDEEDQRTVRDLCDAHYASTGSALAARLVSRWEKTLTEIVKVMPRDYRRVLEATRRAVEAGGSVDDEIMAAAHG
jgi:glutamate synthase (NADPH/NADH) large chain